VALGNVTADGSVLLAKNSDRAAHEAQRLIGVPAAGYAAGASVQCQYIAIPQVSRTAALIGSQPYWLWGFEHGMNEHGVAIGNEAIHTREALQEKGLLGMDLVRLGLERGTTARQALDAITALLEQFGQGGSAAHHATRYYDNSFIIADPREAWVLETAGRRWVARHLTHGYYAISNRPTIGTEYDLASDDLVAYAEERGWWERGRRPFDFAAAYTDPDHSGLASATCRLARSRHHLGTGAPHLLTVTDMMALLRDHGPAAYDDSDSGWLAWPDGREADTVCMHGPDGGTAASMVAHLVPGVHPTYWASMAPPCTGVFVPCWVDTAPPAPLAHAAETPDAASPWWRYRRLWEAVAAADDPGADVTRIRASWRPLEEDVSQQVRDLGPDTTAEARRALSEDAYAESMRVLSHLEDSIGKTFQATRLPLATMT
jgi:dipeptidase